MAHAVDVLLLSKYSRLGASSRLRTMQYLPGLMQAGIRVNVQSLFDDAYLQQLYSRKTRSLQVVARCYLRRLLRVMSLRRVDVIWLEYELLPYCPAWFERWLKWRGIRLVVDYDDAVFHNYDLAGSAVLRKLLGSKIDQVMALADVVVAGNAYIASRAAQAGAQQICRVPTVIDLARYPMPVLSERSGQLTIGWIGSPATQLYLQQLGPLLSELLQQHQARLVLIGANSEAQAYFSGADVEIRQWSEATEVADICDFDIGIMPLPDGPWEQGKCGYKLIQYMACAVPVIASAVGANIDIVGRSAAGLLADSVDSWRQALHRMLSEAEFRAVCGQAGRQAVEQEYSVQAQLPVLRDIFHSMNRTAAK